MGLFDEPIKELDDFLREKLKQLRELNPEDYTSWPEGESIILEEETALELGHPGEGSLSFMVWAQSDSLARDHIFLIGPDLSELKAKRAPFAQVIRVRGNFSDEYECYCELRDAVYLTRLKGFMTRILPSRQTIWCRVDENALEDGFSLGHLGFALLKNLRALSFVSGADVIFITSSKGDLNQLRRTAEKAGRITNALLKMTEEKIFDCQTCEYLDVCEKVLELKEIRRRLNRGFKG